MTGIDRAALIDAAAEAQRIRDLNSPPWPPGGPPAPFTGWRDADQRDYYRADAAAVIDAVLPLIAAEIERTVEPDPIGDWSRGRLSAARMLRELSQDGGNPT